MLSVCLKTMLAVLPTLQTEYDDKFGTSAEPSSWQLPSRYALRLLNHTIQIELIFCYAIPVRLNVLVNIEMIMDRNASEPL